MNPSLPLLLHPCQMTVVLQWIWIVRIAPSSRAKQTIFQPQQTTFQRAQSDSFLFTNKDSSTNVLSNLFDKKNQPEPVECARQTVGPFKGQSFTIVSRNGGGRTLGAVGEIGGQRQGGGGVHGDLPSARDWAAPVRPVCSVCDPAYF